MSNWCTLNKGVTASDKDAVELQVERLLETYQSTLKLQHKGQLEAAKQKYEELVAHQLVKKEPKPKSKVSGASGADHVEESPLSTLRFLVFKNYASMLKDEFMADQKSNEDMAKKALDNYLQAVKIDPTDYSLWFYIGYLSQNLNKLRFARLAYETGFYMSDSERILKFPDIQHNDAIQMIKNGNYTPMQWKCLESLCQVLYDIGDYKLCRFYVDTALARYPQWKVGQQLKDKMESCGSLRIATTENKTMDICRPIDPIEITVDKSDWITLVKSLSKEYKQLVSSNLPSKNSASRDMFFVNHAVHIDIKEEIEEAEEAEEAEEEQQAMNIDQMTKESDIQPIENDHVSQVPLSSNSSSQAVPDVMHEKTKEAVPAPPVASVPIIVGLETTESITPIKPMSDALNSNTNEHDAKGVKRTWDQANTNDAEHHSGSEDEDEDEGDEEDEAEEKRQSLRASKRQREKIANEETSRLKMLEEEKEFAAKAQEFYGQMKSIANVPGKALWFDGPDGPGGSHIEFWDWFDRKISELESTYCWDIDTASNILFDATAIGDSKTNRNLALFIVPRSRPAIKSENQQQKTLLKRFVAEFNNNNSGIVDGLCKTIMAIIANDSVSENQQDSDAMNTESLELITDTIISLETNIVQCILSDTALAQQERICILLRTSEYFVDRLIRNTITTTEGSNLSPSSVGNRRKVTISLAKQAKIRALDSFSEHAEFWIRLVEQNVFSLSIDVFKSTLQDIVAEHDYSPSVEEYEMMMRYCVLKGKIAQCRNAIEDAYAWFDKCRLLLEKAETHFNLKTEMDVKSMYDTFIGYGSIQRKLDLLQVGKLFVTAKQKMRANNYEGVIKDLEELVKPKLSEADQSLDSDETRQMTSMLSIAYLKSGQYLNAWNCYVRLLCSTIRQLVDYGSSQMHVANRPNKNEDVEFTGMLARVSSILNSLVDLVQQRGFEDWLPANMDPDLADALAVLLKMSIYYIFRHPDFVPLVNNFTTPDVPPHTPSKITKSNGFNDILAKSWVLQSTLYQFLIDSNTSASTVSKEVMDRWAKLLQELHDELGEREVCGAAKSVFLKHLMATLAKVDDVTFRREIYQCYHCLYGVHLAAESDMIEEHHCVHSELDQTASEPLFDLVASAAVEKLKSGSLLKNDLKDVIETVSDQFKELKIKNAYLKSNQKIIEDYLNSQVELHPSLNMMLRTSIIPTESVDPKKINASVVLFRIFWIRGKTLRLQIKNRAKLNNEKNMIDLEKAIEEFTSHLILNPNDADGWCDLGACYQLLADEELNWSASNICEHKDLISDYQRKSFHAYLRGLYLRDLPLRDAAKNELFTDIGNLIYSIASSPMNMEAFKASKTKKTLGPDGKATNIQIKAPSSKSAYKLAMIMYNHALRYKTLDRFSWRSYYMSGKCLAKIKRPAKEVLDWYLQAIRITKIKDGRRDLIIEPVYILCSALVKYLYKGEIDAQCVQEYIAAEKALHAEQKKEAENEEQEVIYVGSTSDVPSIETTTLVSNQLSNDLRQFTMHLPVETANAYNAIFQRITDIRTADSKGWHHRPVYRISWMYYYIYHHTEKAKAELLKLFTLRPTVKNHINIWKPGFELPGKHYEYVNKYTLFLIELSKESNDAQTLKYLYRKLRRGRTLILDDKKAFRSAYTAYLSIIKVHLTSIYHATSIVEIIRNSRLEKSKFEAICSTFVKSLTEDKSLLDPELYGLLQDISELRRLTQGFILVTDSDKDGLNDAIQMLFAVVAFGVNVDRLNQIKEAHDDIELNEKTCNEKLEVLSTQAKVLMQNITSTSR